MKIGQEVRIPEMESGEESNREFNIYEVAGINRLGWIWLSILRYQVMDGSWITEGDPEFEYDGYNGDLIIESVPGRAGWYQARIIDERCRLHWVADELGHFQVEEI